MNTNSPAPIPDRILHYIAENPGARLYNIVDAVNASRGAVTYYIRQLTAQGYITSENTSPHKQYYLKTQHRSKEQALIHRFIRSEYTRPILAILLQNPWLTRQEIAELMNKKEGSLFRQINKMHTAGVIERKRDGHKWRYTVSKEAAELLHR